jgi:hypothetical protein
MGAGGMALASNDEDDDGNTPLPLEWRFDNSLAGSNNVAKSISMSSMCILPISMKFQSIESSSVVVAAADAPELDEGTG